MIDKLGDWLDDKFKDKEGIIYWGCLIFGILMLIYYGFVAILEDIMPGLDMGCVLKSTFDIPCPGCGGTRAFMALMEFDILEALYHHTTFVIAFFSYAYFFVITTLSKLSHGKVKPITIPDWYIVMILVVLVIQYIIKLLTLY